MKTIFALIIFLPAVAFTQPPRKPSATECAADISQYTEAGLKKRKSIFDPKGKNTAQVLPSKLMDVHFQDEALLKDGTKVTYVVGGCAHYDYGFTFQGPKIAKVADNQKIARAEKLLKNLELLENGEQSQLLGALKDAKAQKPANLDPQTEINLPCGDANCTLQDQGDQKVSISYDFAL